MRFLPLTKRQCNTWGDKHVLKINGPREHRYLLMRCSRCHLNVAAWLLSDD